MIVSVQGLDRFNDRLRHVARVLPERVGFVQRFVVTKAVVDTEDRTPVDRGFLRGNWHASNGSPVTTFDQGSTGSRRDANIAIAQAAKAFSASYLTNTAPYARTVERGGFVPADPKTDPESLERRAARRDER